MTSIRAAIRPNRPTRPDDRLGPIKASQNSIRPSLTWGTSLGRMGRVTSPHRRHAKQRPTATAS